MSPALTPLVRSFVSHFGEMGSRWGINRTVGQIYALIYVSSRPLNADERLVHLRHQPSDRREYFESPADAWEVFRTLAEERRRREIEPTLTMLRSALLEEPSTPEDRFAQARMKGMHDLIELTTSWFDDVQRMDAATLAQLMKMGSKVQRLLELKDKLKVVPGGRG